MTRVVAIHQPNFFPWLGYFDKMARSQCFVFLDDVQIQKTGGGWANRVKMFVAGVPKWVTAPIDRNYHGGRQIRETRFVDKSDWRSDMLRTIRQSYKNSPHYKYTSDLITPLLMNPDNNLASYNATTILAIAEELGISKSGVKFSSELAPAGQSNERLISIIKSVAGDAYMYGGGADGYQEDHMFEASSISLIRQNYSVVPYPQCGYSSFAAGLSVVDVLMNIGKEGAISLLAAHPSLSQSDL